jgi:hypothetical protein
MQACARFASQPGFSLAPRRTDDGKMVTGEPKFVAGRLLEMKERAQADEIVVVTPSVSRERRKVSYVALADAWRRATA